MLFVNVIMTLNYPHSALPWTQVEIQTSLKPLLYKSWISGHLSQGVVTLREILSLPVLWVLTRPFLTFLVGGKVLRRWIVRLSMAGEFEPGGRNVHTMRSFGTLYVVSNMHLCLVYNMTQYRCNNGTVLCHVLCMY